MGLSPGQRLTFRTLLYGLMLPSGNDAAEQLARSVAESRADADHVAEDMSSHGTCAQLFGVRSEASEDGGRVLLRSLVGYRTAA